MERLYTLVWQDEKGAFPIGYMPQAVYDALIATPVTVRGEMDFDRATRSIKLFHKASSEPERTALAAKLVSHWREQQAFKILKGWRNEPWPVYGRNGEILFKMERVAVGLFGMARYGVHMHVFLMREDDTSKYPFRIWVSKRSPTKSNYPGMLDNSVAGGLAEETPLEGMIREADEEGSLPEDLMRSRVKCVSTVSYVYITDPRSGGESGLIYPELQWVYDLELPADGSVVPTPKDGEVENFKLHTVEDIQAQMAQGLWKPNCAVIMLDFLIRHGILTPENEPHYDEIQRRIHRRLPFPGPRYEASQIGA
jgi:8-oxo-dGTP pyrophosphatase MutT (NUDIX family)